LKILIGAACACVIAATGYYFIGEYRTAQHEAECKHLISAARGFGHMVDRGHADFRDMLRKTAGQIVAADCDWRS